MRTERFWTGFGIITVLALAISMAIPGSRPAPSVPVEGTVAVHGRPFAGGAIFFTPEKLTGDNGASAVIDEDGHFECDLRWRRDRAARVRYRIDVVRLPSTPSSNSSPLGPDGRPKPGGGEVPDPTGAEEQRPTRRIARATLRSGGVPSAGRAVGSDRRRPSGDVQRFEREVWLGPEPAHLDIDLGD